MKSTETQALTTKENHTSTKTPSSDQSRKWTEQFKTFDSPVLELMLEEALCFHDEFSFPHSQKRWLSFLGGCGTGKTFLANMLLTRARRFPHLSQHRELVNGALKLFWPRLLTDMRCGNYEQMRDACDAHFLLIDELSVEHDPRGFARDKLCELISMRVGKWTVITSNLTLNKIAELDVRISSRMIRAGSVVVECDTQDYSFRPKL